MFNQYQHLLPRARAWDLIADKMLRRLFVALGMTSGDANRYLSLVLGDLEPQRTRRLPQWEQQFNLPDSGITEQQRRDRLEAAWSATGGQSPAYIQSTLQAAGFPVYVHEWWVPGSDPVTARNPGLVLRDDGDAVQYQYELGTTNAECGDSRVECGALSGAEGYLLVNKIVDNNGDRVEYDVPKAQTQWSYVLYIGGETYPEVATVASSRRDEFEELLLSISPGQQWLGMLVGYGAG